MTKEKLHNEILGLRLENERLREQVTRLVRDIDALIYERNKFRVIADNALTQYVHAKAGIWLKEENGGLALYA